MGNDLDESRFEIGETGSTLGVGCLPPLRVLVLESIVCLLFSFSYLSRFLNDHIPVSISQHLASRLENLMSATNIELNFG